MLFQSFLIQRLLLAFSFLAFIFWSWQKGRQAGFNKEKFLDLSLFSIVTGISFFYLFSHLLPTPELFFLLGFGLFVIYYCLRQGWSAYKAADIYTEALSLSLIVYPLFPKPIFNVFSILVFWFLRKVAAVKPRTGFTFLSFLVLFSLLLPVFYLLKLKRVEYFSLIFSLGSLVYAFTYLARKEYKSSFELLKYSLPADILFDLKRRLTDRLKSLEVQETNLSDEMKIETTLDDSSFTEKMLDENTTSEEKDHLDEIKKSKEEVDKALKRMEGGSYGLCQKCGKPIDRARLEAFPESRFCWSCAPVEENK